MRCCRCCSLVVPWDHPDFRDCSGWEWDYLHLPCGVRRCGAVCETHHVGRTHSQHWVWGCFPRMLKGWAATKL